MPRSRPLPDRTDTLAVVLVDYDDLIESLTGRTRQKDQPHRFVLAMLAELKRYLGDELRIRTVRTVAFGDFGRHGVDASLVLADLAAAGAEPRYVPSAADAADSGTAVTLQAAEVLHTRPDLSAVVVLTGDNGYVPLVQQLLRFGRFVLVAALELPKNLGSLDGDVADAYLNARFLLDARSRDSLNFEPVEAEGRAAAPAASALQRAPEITGRVSDPGVMRALELIEEFFGQYEEVYLTPLLRKMSEHMDESDGEPKDLVNALHEIGAVWLEKRRGFPYDYTVLLVNTEHPDVAVARATVEAMEKSDDFDDEDDYDDEDGYDDDAYDDDAYEDEEDEEDEEDDDEEEADADEDGGEGFDDKARPKRGRTN